MAPGGWASPGTYCIWGRLWMNECLSGSSEILQAMLPLRHHRQGWDVGGGGGESTCGPRSPETTLPRAVQD